MRIALAGATGNFGKLARIYFSEGGHSVVGIGRDNWASTDFSAFDVCFLSVPVTEVGNYLQYCNDSTVIEISSVKEPLKKYSGRLVSIHPIFGPRSIGDPRFRNIIYVEDLSIEGGRDIVQRLFPGFKIIDLTADEHDRSMVEVLIKPFIMSRIASLISIDNLGFKGPSQSVLQQLASISGSESSGVLMDTIKLNPYARKVMTEIGAAVEKLEDEISR